jgi:hypothetical protein
MDPWSRGVAAEQSANGPIDAIRDRRESTTLFGQLVDKRTQGHANLDPNCVAADVEDRAKVYRQIKHKAAAQGSAHWTCAASADDEGHLIFTGVSDQCAEIVLVARDDNASRLDFKQRAIGRVQHPREIVEEQLAADDPFKIVMQPFS